MQQIHFHEVSHRWSQLAAASADASADAMATSPPLAVASWELAGAASRSG